MVDGSIPRFSCHAQNAIMKGVKVKIMKGLKAWNQVTGISPCQTMRSMVRSVWPSAHSAMALPCCVKEEGSRTAGRIYPCVQRIRDSPFDHDIREPIRSVIFS